MGVILTLAVHDRHGGGRRKHRQPDWRCFLGDSDHSGKAAVRKGEPAVSRRFPPGPGYPPWRRCLQHRHGDSDHLPASLFLAVSTARTRMVGTSAMGPLGAHALPMPLAWAVQGPPNRAPQRFSLSALQTVKIAMGATAPVAPLQLRRLHSEPASLLKGLSRWASRRSSGGRPPAPRECQNGRRGLLTAERSFGGNRLAGGDRRGQNDRLCLLNLSVPHVLMTNRLLMYVALYALPGLVACYILPARFELGHYCDGLLANIWLIG
ncbi:hypothetical protein NDU88_004614 [Pleurodeles waltl]|uniref:Uncharacterized protein n=1 Tax=Pleurodeles waltl TaxID=8319 RepID=A0AAV7MC70_PLEWA|nr:hypothetical protein NDU88_004614 [Pleurodeles waltl]